MSTEIVTVGALPGRQDPAEAARRRLLRALQAGIPLPYGGWRHRPGALPWWQARVRLGGRVATGDFVRAVEALVSQGLVLELWLETPGRLPDSRVLMLPGHSSALEYPVARARGRADVLAGEPWAAALGRGLG